MEDFIIQLSSRCSVKDHPKNTLNKFTNTLPRTLYLSEGFEVGLVELIFPRNFVKESLTLSKDDTVFLEAVNFTKSERVQNVVFTICLNCSELCEVFSLDTLTKEINSEVRKTLSSFDLLKKRVETNRPERVSVKPDETVKRDGKEADLDSSKWSKPELFDWIIYSDESSEYPSIFFDDISNRYKIINILDRGSGRLLRLSFSESLAKRFGFAPTQFPDVKIVGAVYPRVIYADLPTVTDNIEKMNVCASIVDARYGPTEHSQLLRTVKIHESSDFNVRIAYEDPLFFPVKVGECDAISVDLFLANTSYVPFANVGEVNCVLRFRQKFVSVIEPGAHPEGRTPEGGFPER